MRRPRESLRPMRWAGHQVGCTEWAFPQGPGHREEAACHAKYDRLSLSPGRLCPPDVPPETRPWVFKIDVIVYRQHLSPDEALAFRHPMAHLQTGGSFSTFRHPMPIYAVTRRALSHLKVLERSLLPPSSTSLDQAEGLPELSSQGFASAGQMLQWGRPPPPR